MAGNVQNKPGSRVRALRESRNLLQKNVADALHVSVSAYAKLESGDRGISSENCIDIADFFGVSCDYILRGIECQNVDICKRTCLEQKTIDILEENQRQCENNQSALNLCENDLSVLIEGVPQNNAAAWINEVRIQEAKCDELHRKIIEQQAAAALLNMLITNSTFWKEVMRACGRVADSMTDAIRTRTNSADGNMPKWKEDACLLEIDAARYVAGHAFDSFFSMMCSDEYFIKSIVKLSENEFEKAKDLGIIRHND